MKTQGKLVLILAISSFFVSNSFGQAAHSDDLSKKAWIKANPHEYFKMGGQNQVVPEFSTKAEKELWFKLHGNQVKALTVDPPKVETSQYVNIFPEISDFPKYMKTGDKNMDDSNYDQAKQQWINSHQLEYQSLTKSGSASSSELKERISTSSKNN